MTDTGREATDDLVRRLEAERCRLTPRLTPEDTQRARERRIELAAAIGDYDDEGDTA